MLSSAEIGTLITALGCGVEGGGNFDLSKLRYHQVIIMTDADVDGSHIRTLLLTFFYRQMPEIIRQGHLYIAQPPLYQVKKGKKIRYLKHEEDLYELLLDLGLEDLVVRTKTGQVPLTGDPLRRLLGDLLRWRALLRKAERRAQPQVLEALIRATDLDTAGLADRARVDAAIESMRAYLAKKAPELLPLDAEVTHDEEHDRFRVVVTPRAGVSTRSTKIDFHLLDTGELSELREIRHGIEALGEMPFYAIEDGKTDQSVEIGDADDLWGWVDARARKGLGIQRYKGLGEMNPAQLWETTMNPETRTLLSVRIDDAVESEELFSVLMGDQVEPRREFIEKNALDVRNLDI